MPSGLLSLASSFYLLVAILAGCLIVARILEQRRTIHRKNDLLPGQDRLGPNALASATSQPVLESDTCYSSLDVVDKPTPLLTNAVDADSAHVQPILRDTPNTLAAPRAIQNHKQGLEPEHRDPPPYFLKLPRFPTIAQMLRESSPPTPSSRLEEPINTNTNIVLDSVTVIKQRLRFVTTNDASLEDITAERLRDASNNPNSPNPSDVSVRKRASPDHTANHPAPTRYLNLPRFPTLRQMLLDSFPAALPTRLPDVSADAFPAPVTTEDANRTEVASGSSRLQDVTNAPAGTDLLPSGDFNKHKDATIRKGRRTYRPRKKEHRS